jgi:DNA-binding NarL/FixJ family response regulator
VSRNPYRHVFREPLRFTWVSYVVEGSRTDSDFVALIVDDHDVLRRLLQIHLEEWFPNLSVVEASDAESALELAEEVTPDLVVLDITLPGMNGIEATRILKQRRPELPVVILSVHELEAYRNDARDAGADAYVPKRLMNTELETVLTGLLSGPTLGSRNEGQPC